VTRDGVIVAQFQTVDAAEGAAEVIPEAVVVAARSPGLRARLEQFGLTQVEAALAIGLIDPSAVVVIARASGPSARDDLREISARRGGDLLYVPPRAGTTRSSPNDQSANASSSTSR
jgi:hypothetical protein